MFGSALLSVVLAARLGAVGRQEQSPALLAQAAEFRVDVWTAAAVGVALVAIRITGFTIIDPIMSLVVAELIKANKDFDLLLLPNRRHGYAAEPYVIRRRWDYFVRYLMGAEPPQGYELKPPARTEPGANGPADEGEE
jgi:hypothetical protein